MTPNFEKGRRGYAPQAVVLHITEGSSESALSWFANPTSQVSSHYLVKENGDVVSLVDENDTAWHAGFVRNPKWKGLIPKVNPNLYTIGVEVALKSAHQFPGWKQWLATARLVDEICERWNIPKDENGVVHHNEIREDKTCPGVWITRFYLFLLLKVVK